MYSPYQTSATYTQYPQYASQYPQYATQYPQYASQYQVQQQVPMQGNYAQYPQQYGGYSYSHQYDPRQPFIMPMGVSPQVAAKMMQASQVFRMFDRDHNGFLDKEEWKRAMYQLGYSTNKVDAKKLFYMADQDLSNRISEREFCEFWLKANPY